MLKKPAAQRVRRASQRFDPIAIVGMACRFPGGADSPGEYWSLLREGRDAIRDCPADRWKLSEYYDENWAAPGKTSCARGGFLASHPGDFDAELFGISRVEAQAMDPQQRLVLEVAWEALESAGIPADTLSGSDTSVHLGCGSHDFSLRSSQHLAKLSSFSAIGAYTATISARLSHFLGLRGASTVIEAGCAASLAALHRACRDLNHFEADLSIAGGVHVLLTPDGFVSMSKAGMLSEQGACRTFDASADGFVRGEGCGILVLKRLPDALAGGDRILAVIRGDAFGHAGTADSISGFDREVQADIMRRALEAAGVTPSEVSYVEAHGTGTLEGDAIEMDAIASVYAEPGRAPLVVGSVKPNLGHLEAASGVASVIKLILMLRHREIPRVLGLESLSPRIDLTRVPVVIPTTPAPWTGAGRRLAAINNFAAQGSVACLVIEEPPERAPSTAARAPQILALSAHSDAALRALVARYLHVLSDCDSLADLCHSANGGRAHLPRRAAFVAATQEAMRQELRAFLDGGAAAAAVDGPSSLAALRRDYVEGGEIDWAARAAGGARKVELPTYPFQRARYWIDAPAPPPPSFLDQLRQAGDAERKALLSNRVQAALIRMLDLREGSSVDAHESFADLGLDSRLLVEMRSTLVQDLGGSVGLTSSDLFDYPSVTELTDYLLGELEPVLAA